MWNVQMLGGGSNSGPNSHFGGHGVADTENLLENASFRTELKRSQAVVSLCIKQITDYKGDDDFQLFGTPAKVVGVLRKVSMQSTQAKMIIEDHTGFMIAVLFIESLSDQDQIPKNREGTYLKIYGSIRSQPQSNEKMLMIINILPVDNSNDITTHLLEVIHARYATEASQKKQVNTANSRAAALTRTLNPDMMETDVVQTVTACSLLNNGLTEFQDKVYRILLSEDSFIGLPRKAVFNSFPVNQANDVKLALEKLLCDGFVYTTLDEEHYKAMDAL